MYILVRRCIYKYVAAFIVSRRIYYIRQRIYKYVDLYIHHITQTF